MKSIYGRKDKFTILGVKCLSGHCGSDGLCEHWEDGFLFDEMDTYIPRSSSTGSDEKTGK